MSGEVAIAADIGPGAISSVEIGINGSFKVGCWTPINAKIDVTGELKQPRIDVIATDNDGVSTVASAPVQVPGEQARRSTSIVFTKVGRIGSPIRVLLADGKRIIDERVIRSNAVTQPGTSALALPATAEMIVALSSQPLGLAAAFPDRQQDGTQLARRVIEINRPDALPTKWFGYEAVDVLLISAGDGKLCRELAADAKRFAALTEWIELGGRLVLFCDGQSAKELLPERGLFARFAPGTFVETIRLRESAPLEHFAGTTTQIVLSTADAIRVPRFRDVHANVEAFAEQPTSGLPLLTRAPFGLGEVAFVSVDIGRSPLAEWSGRSAFLQSLLRPYLANINSSDASQRLVTRGYNDLSGALRQQLGRSFVRVMPIGFGVVALFAIAYMIFLGPLDYLLVNRWMRRPKIAWVSFPVLVLVFCGGAAWLAEWRKGGPQLRANSLEIVDVDAQSGRARGTYWSALYSPQASELNVSFTPSRSLTPPNNGEVLLSWWGLPGAGIGGMQAGGAEFGSGSDAYRYGAGYQSLENVPILASASKSLIARWTAPTAMQIEAELADDEGLAVGHLTNRTGTALHNVRLLYATWAYRLGTLKPGQQVEVNEQLSPRKVKTVVTHDAFGTEVSAEGRVFAAEQADTKEILNLMMFYEAAGGYGFAHLPNRYQAFCDMSRILDLGRAVLVAETSDPGSQLTVGESEISTDGSESQPTVIYRFVLPVNRNGSSGSK